MGSLACIRIVLGVWVVLASGLAISGEEARAANRSHVVESAADWEQAYNAWEESHGAPDRIVAFLDRGSRSGVRVLEVQLSWRTSHGTVEVCGWFAIRASVGRNPGRQIIRDGREDCERLRRATDPRAASVA